MPINTVQTQPKNIKLANMTVKNAESVSALIKHSANINGKKIYFTDLYAIKQYPSVCALIETAKGEYQARILYFSQSRAQWRVAPTVAHNGRFCKGHGSTDVNLPPELNIALTEKFLSSPEHRQPDKFPTLLYQSATPPIQHHFADYPAGYEEEVQFDPTQTRDTIQKPDFKRGLLEMSHFTNDFYSEIADNNKMTHYRVLSEDKNHEYLIAEIEKDNKPFRFVLSVTKADATLSSYLVASSFVDIGIYEPIMRPDQLLETEKTATSKIKNNAYHNTFELAANAPTNVFLNSLGKVVDNAQFVKVTEVNELLNKINDQRNLLKAKSWNPLHESRRKKRLIALDEAISELSKIKSESLRTEPSIINNRLIQCLNHLEYQTKQTCSQKIPDKCRELKEQLNQTTTSNKNEHMKEPSSKQVSPGR